MNTVRNGLFVSVDYTGTLANGEVFDSSEGELPLEIQMGEGQLIDGFEAALMGMALNEKKTFTLTPDDAYGQRDEELIYTFSREEVPPEANPEEGETLVLTDQDGNEVAAVIIEVTDEKIVVDLNHPLAGESLTFAIEVVGISETATQEPHACSCGCEETDCGSRGSGGCESGGCSSNNF